MSVIDSLRQRSLAFALAGAQAPRHFASQAETSTPSVTEQAASRVRNAGHRRGVDAIGRRTLERVARRRQEALS